MFISAQTLSGISWQAFERVTQRLLVHEGFGGVRLVGQSSDEGADVLASSAGKRWLFQVKRWRRPVGQSVVDRTLEALHSYRADIPVIVSLGGFEPGLLERQRSLLAEGVPMQLWDRHTLLERAKRLTLEPASQGPPPRPYQQEAIDIVVERFTAGHENRALVVMATGLGKTFVAAQAVQRMRASRPCRVLVLAHRNEIVYQLEKAFWPTLSAEVATTVWNGLERPSDQILQTAPFVFACVDTLFERLSSGAQLPAFDIVLVDECHHVGAEMYPSVLAELRAGQVGGPFLLGLTATPWRPGEESIEPTFGAPAITVDLVYGMKRGYLANVDYRMFTDNIDWEALASLQGRRFSPKRINRTLFIRQWDDAVVFELQRVWAEQEDARCIVFCGTIEHAVKMRDRINSLGFCTAAAVYSATPSAPTLSPAERNRILCDFHDGVIQTVCAVDIFNEGIDVPDVNIIVFQRVTHSRRIFVQQLGRGLRLTDGKEKVIVLDFVSDIRRFAAGIDLKDALASDAGQRRHLGGPSEPGDLQQGWR